MKKKDDNCAYCADYSDKKGCKHKTCRWRDELDLKKLHYRDEWHRKRMKKLCKKNSPGRDAPKWYAVAYLLSSNSELYRRTADCFHDGGLELSCAKVKGIDEQNYTLLSAAKDIYNDDSKVTLSDLALFEIVDRTAFVLIIEALRIARSDGGL